MGYDPPPARPANPKPARIPMWEHERPIRRQRRNRINDVPGSLTTKIEVGMKVVALNADGTRWEWRTFLIFDGCPSLMDSIGGSSWRRPSQYEVRGRTRDEGKAWDLAREAADDARARHAAQQVRLRRASSDRVPL